MPTPLAHTIGGLTAVRLLDGRTGRRLLVLTLFAILYANLPDLDFLPGLLVGEPRAYHRGPSHSLTAALLVGLGTGAVARWRGQGIRLPFLLAFAAYGSHLLLDAITPDTHGRAGIPLLWPFSDIYIGQPVPIPPQVRDFLTLPLGDDSGSFVRGLLSTRGLMIILIEGALFTPMLAIPPVVRRLRRGRRGSDPHGGAESSRDLASPAEEGAGD